ncbi:MAG: hypothetical protein ACRCX2_21150 [Paraclostridium sp.]
MKIKRMDIVGILMIAAGIFTILTVNEVVFMSFDFWITILAIIAIATGSLLRY